MTDGIPEDIIRYIAVRDAQRRDRVERALGALTERELRLVREAAVMGYIQGRMATQAGVDAIPKDSNIVWCVIDACYGASDLYPTISTLAVPHP